MRVTVTTADGTEHDYEVVGRRAIVKKALPVDEIFARDGRPLLVLITCGGEYLPELRSHRDNIVVTAVPVVCPRLTSRVGGPPACPTRHPQPDAVSAPHARR